MKLIKKKKHGGGVLHDLFTIKNVGTSCINVYHMHRDISPYDDYGRVRYEKGNDHNV